MKKERKTAEEQLLATTRLNVCTLETFISAKEKKKIQQQQQEQGGEQFHFYGRGNNRFTTRVSPTAAATARAEAEAEAGERQVGESKGNASSSGSSNGGSSGGGNSGDVPTLRHLQPYIGGWEQENKEVVEEKKSAEWEQPVTNVEDSVVCVVCAMCLVCVCLVCVLSVFVLILGSIIKKQFIAPRFPPRSCWH